MVVSTVQLTATSKEDRFALSPLRQRMIEETEIGDCSPETIEKHVFYVARFAKHRRGHRIFWAQRRFAGIESVCREERKISLPILNFALRRFATLVHVSGEHDKLRWVSGI